MKKIYENPIIEVLELEIETADNLSTNTPVTQPGTEGDGSWPWGN